MLDYKKHRIKILVMSGIVLLVGLILAFDLIFVLKLIIGLLFGIGGLLLVISLLTALVGFVNLNNDRNTNKLGKEKRRRGNDNTQIRRKNGRFG